VLKLLRRRSDLYLSYIMFTCSALFGKELASSGGWNQAYCSAESARIGVLFFNFWARCLFLLSKYLLSLKIPGGFRGQDLRVCLGVVDDMSILLGHRLHLSMDVDLYTFVDTCCLHYHQFWRIGLYIYIYSRDMKPSSKLEARKIHYQIHISSVSRSVLHNQSIVILCIIINRTRNTKHHTSYLIISQNSLYLSAPPIHTPNSISQSVILTPYTANQSQITLQPLR
jgi:hypothetical protein